MSLLDLASFASYCRGIDYCKSKSVVSYKNQGKGIYTGIVKGSKNYHVQIDVKHPKKSTCDCPFAKDRLVICKHKVALYLTVFPSELERIEKEQEEYELMQEQREKEFESALDSKRNELIKYVKKLTKKELEDRLVNLLMNEQYDDLRKQYFDDDNDYYDRWY